MLIPLALCCVVAQSPRAAPAPRSSGDPAVVATNRLGMDLEHALAALQPEQNLFFSPWSITVALTMVAEGARGETAAELAKILHLPSPLEPAHTAFAELARRLQAGGADGELNELLPRVDRYELRSANALWADRRQSVLPTFVAALDRHYGAGGVAVLDFLGDPDGSRGRINAWVEEHTERRIRDLLPRGSVTPDTRLVVTNAVWFRGEWSAPFDPQQTKDEDFTRADGRRVVVPMMNASFGRIRYGAFDRIGNRFATPRFVSRDPQQAVPTYPGDDGFELIELPYKGGTLAMTLLVPRSPTGLARLNRLLTAKALGLWLGRTEPREVIVAMPRLRLEAAYELTDVLKGLGMNRAFTAPGPADGADFSGIADEPDPAKRLWIGGVHHKAWVSIDEKGTEAAAATSVGALEGAAMPADIPFVPVVRADRPFLFLIRDTVSGAILFVGRVVDPRAAS